MPWLILSVLVFAWGYPTIKTALNSRRVVQPSIEVPYLHNLVLKAAPIVAKPTPEAAKFTFNWISATGTALLLTGIIAGPPARAEAQGAPRSTTCTPSNGSGSRC